MLKQRLLSALIVSSLALTPAFAKEPVNLAVIKQQLQKYHDDGHYQKDIKNVINQAMRYLKIYQSRHLHTQKKPAIVLDIDETSLSNYSDMVKLSFGGTIEEIRRNADQGHDPAILPTLRLYRYAKANNIAVFFITGRHDFERKATEVNLKKAGYTNWDGLILKEGRYKKSTAAEYKIAMRKKLVNEGYDIILNIGDQKSDLTGGYADKTYKLPNPYYYIA